MTSLGLYPSSLITEVIFWKLKQKSSKLKQNLQKLKLTGNFGCSWLQNMGEKISLALRVIFQKTILPKNRRTGEFNMRFLVQGPHCSLQWWSEGEPHEVVPLYQEISVEQLGLSNQNQLSHTNNSIMWRWNRRTRQEMLWSLCSLFKRGKMTLLNFLRWGVWLRHPDGVPEDELLLHSSIWSWKVGPTMFSQ